MTVKITIIYDNRCDKCHLKEGWGFSAFIEYGGSKILFDTGGDPSAFLFNAQALQLPFDQMTHLAFSHRHWDHIAGFKNIIDKLPNKTVLCVPKTFPWILRRYASSRLKKTQVIRFFEPIAPDIYSLVLRGGFWLYEQALVLKMPQGLGIITGCAHAGIIQILKAAKQHLQTDIYFVLGGFHLLFQPSAHSADVVEEFQKLRVQKVAPCHCSGEHTIRQFQEAYGAEFLKVGTGTILDL